MSQGDGGTTAVPNKQKGRRIDRSVGTVYKLPDEYEPAEARLLVLKYSARCEVCSERLQPGSDVLGMNKDQPANKLDRWAFLCMDCAQDTPFEPLTNGENPFLQTRRADVTEERELGPYLKTREEVAA